VASRKGIQSASLMQKRYIFDDNHAPKFELAQAMAEAAFSGIRNTVAEALCVAVSNLTSSYGLGYRDTTYRGFPNGRASALPTAQLCRVGSANWNSHTA
jgi:hypothetical protein